jgi:hypothetical protein
MFSSTPTRGRNRCAVSSWKLDTSTTAKPPAPAAGVPTASLSGVPRFPPTNVGCPVAASISPTSVVVVDLPLVPVMATTGAAMNCAASSSSPVMGTPALRAAATSASGGTPGDSTTSCADRKLCARCPPSSRATPAGSAASAAASAASGWRSVTVTRAPRRAHSAAAATPERPRPTTSTRLPARSTPAIAHLTFRVTSSPATANEKAMIQARTTMRDSGQPFFSKWWWMGAIRNTRFLVRL